PNPPVQGGILGEELQDGLVGHEQVVRIAGERGPAEWPFPLAEQRPYEKRHEAAHRERDDSDGDGLAAIAGLDGALDPGVEARCHLVEITLVEAALDPRAIHL